jgi:hypothetical protein
MKLIRTLSTPLLANRLQNGTADQLIKSTTQISERRLHYSVGGVPQVRVAARPVDVVGLDLDAEEDSPEYLAALENDQENDNEDVPDPDESVPTSSQSPTKPKKTHWLPWNMEKVWLLETQVELGAPQIFEEWNDIQRMKAEAKLAAARAKEERQNARAAKTKPVPKKDLPRIDQYFAAARKTLPTAEVLKSAPIEVERSSLKPKDDLAASRIPRTPPRRKPQARARTVANKSPDLIKYFQAAKAVPGRGLMQNSAAVEKAEPKDLKHARPASPESISKDDLDLPVFSFSMKGSFDNPIALTSSPAPASTCSTELLLTPLKADGATHALRTSQTTPPIRAIEESVTQRKTRRNTRRKLSRSRTEGSEPFDGSLPIDEPLSPSARKTPASMQSTASVLLDEEDGFELPRELSTGLKLGFARRKVFAIPRESLEGAWKEVDGEEEFASATSRRLARVSCVNLAAD